MRSSGISSAKGSNPPPSPAQAAPQPGAPTRRVFALTGRSRQLDPRENAVRADIADVRLAEYVFAPHYAAHSLRTVIQGAMLRETRDPASATMGALRTGDAFELLDVTGGAAWGIAPALGLVGYLDEAALGAAA